MRIAIFAWFLLILLLILSAWLFVPYQNEFFKADTGTNNFSLTSYGKENMQFYPNMRFPDSKISYNIEKCPLKRVNDMERAFQVIEELSVIDFYKVSQNEEIEITCDETKPIEGELFIAGEGGPSRILRGKIFNIILEGQILLFRDSVCSEPNVAIHELLHVLGFNHSENQNNLMYPISDCDQTMGDDTISLLNDIYSVENLPDLAVENASAKLHGRYLDLNFSVQNYGLKNSKETTLTAYCDKKNLKDIKIGELEIGHGIYISLTNIGTNKISCEEITLKVNYFGKELDKQNNELVLR